MSARANHKWDNETAINKRRYKAVQSDEKQNKVNKGKRSFSKFLEMKLHSNSPLIFPQSWIYCFEQKKVSIIPKQSDGPPNCKEFVISTFRTINANVGTENLPMLILTWLIIFRVGDCRILCFTLIKEKSKVSFVQLKIYRRGGDKSCTMMANVQSITK